MTLHAFPPQHPVRNSQHFDPGFQELRAGAVANSHQLAPSVASLEEPSRSVEGDDRVLLSYDLSTKPALILLDGSAENPDIWVLQSPVHESLGFGTG